MFGNWTNGLNSAFATILNVMNVYKLLKLVWLGVGEVFDFWLFVPRLFEEKQRDMVFGFPSFRPSVRLSVRPCVRASVLPSFRPPIGVCTLCKQLILQFYSNSFETLQIS